MSDTAHSRLRRQLFKVTSPRAKLAFFVPSMRGGGAERVTLTLAREVAERGYEVDLVLAKAEGPYLAEVPSCVRVVDLDVSRVLFALPLLMRYLRRHRPDAMLSTMAHSSIVAIWARKLANVSTRIVVSLHDGTLSEESKSVSSIYPLPLFLAGRCIRWADSIVAVSNGTADVFARMARVPRECIQVIYNPVLRPELQCKSQSTLDDSWFEPGEPPVLLSAGRLIQCKDFATLIRAFAQVRKQRATRLVILGEGPERPVLEGLIRDLNIQHNVRLPGFVDNVYAYMSRASLFVLSSQYEALPSALIEAMCCGIPVISTDCPHGPHEILEGGKYGRLVPVGDVDAMVQSIETTLDGEWTLSSADSLQRFELQTVVDQYLSLLDKN